jgi:signal transduction histidine kinase/ActR/RegA family two-component response regulator
VPYRFDGDLNGERARTFHRLVVYGIVLLSVMLLVSVSLRPARLWAHFPYAAMLVEHVVVLLIHRRGRLRTAVAVHATLYSAVVFAAMCLDGGVRSPACFVLPPIVLFVGLTWDRRAALVTALAVSAGMLGLVVLEEQGVLHGILEPTSPMRFWIVATGALVITSAILQVALNILGHSQTELASKEQARRELEESLARSRRLEAVGRLAAGVAHDFNNLLTVIFAHAGQLSAHGDPLVEASAKATLDAAGRAANMTRQLLAYGRRQVLEPKVVDIHEFLRGAESLFGRFLGDDVRLTLELDPEPTFARVDRTQLEQVVLNLIVNAREAMPAGGTVTLRTTRGPGTVRISVADTGEGMSSEVRARIFEPFFSSKGRGNGTGLGLATVHGIVEQSGGHVEVESTPGRGSCFTVVLPAERRIVQQTKSVRTARPTNQRASVLVVDDDEHVRAAVNAILTAAGHEVRIADSARSAIEAVEDTDVAPDLLVTDVVMPDMPGPELAARLRERRPDLRVLFMSGYADDRLSIEGVLAEGVHLISKPFDGPTILERVRDVLASENLGVVVAAKPLT